MNEFSLLYPQGTAPGFQKISETACNDLSMDYILSHVAKSEYEKNLIKRMMIGVESDPDVIRYRSDFFEDFINYPSFKDKIKVASLVTGIHEGQRSYKVYLAPPDGISYAIDIAEKYGATYSQLMKAAG